MVVEDVGAPAEDQTEQLLRLDTTKGQGQGFLELGDQSYDQSQSLKITKCQHGFLEPKVDDQPEKLFPLETTEDHALLGSKVGESQEKQIRLQPPTQEINNKPENVGFDIGMAPPFPTSKEIEEMVRQGHLPHPE